MNFTDAIKVCFEKYAQFEGRATRPEYWWFFLAVFLGSCITYAISPTLCTIFGLATLIPMLSVGARRLHDTNRSGWWQLLGLIPLGEIVVLILMALPTVPAAAEGS